MKNQNKSLYYILAAIVCVGIAVYYFLGGTKNGGNEAIELMRQSKVE